MKVMNKKETVHITIMGMALLATVITMSSSAPALGLGHWNLDEKFDPGTGYAKDGMDSSQVSDDTSSEVEDAAVDAAIDSPNEDSTTAIMEDGYKEAPAEASIDNTDSEEVLSDVAYEEFQNCLMSMDGEPTEQKVQDCLGLDYTETDSSDSTPMERTEVRDGNEDADADEDVNAVSEGADESEEQEDNEEIDTDE